MAGRTVTADAEAHRLTFLGETQAAADPVPNSQNGAEVAVMMLWFN